MTVTAAMVLNSALVTVFSHETANGSARFEPFKLSDNSIGGPRGKKL
jgi:hypothetical protein